jgi:exosome complex component RRP41
VVPLTGVLQAAINATTLALIDAGIALFDYVVAVSAGLHSTSILLDLTNTEESDLPHLTVAVMPRSGKVTLLNMESRLHVTRFGDVLKVAGQAAEVLRDEMRSAVRSRSKALISAMEYAGASQGTTGGGGYGDDMDL